MLHGSLCIVLHAHLPFVRHPEQPHTLEEDWLYEAITETYIPLLRLMEGWERDNIPYRLTLGLTPPLLAMLEDELLCHRYRAHLANLEKLAAEELERTQGDPRLRRVAQMYAERFQQTAESWDRYRGRLIPAFRYFQENGGLEILASAATHGYLPMMAQTPEMARAQISIGCEAYRRAFGRNPLGFWLPECGYFPGQDRWLAAEGVQYTFVDSHGILHASSRPRYGLYAPIISSAGVAVFGRDGESSKQVWSADEGYPGDFDYREFFRDIGFDLPWETIQPFLKHGIRANTGVKYHRITGQTVDKEIYDPDRAAAKAYQHARNFIFNRERQIEWLHHRMDRPPVIIAPYDAELFGHWWFEGPMFLDGVVRRAAETPVVNLATPSDYLMMHPRNQHAEPSQSSWGLKGYHEVWLEGTNDWIYRHLHTAAKRMVDLVQGLSQGGQFNDLRKRAANQAARELLLAQSSDWAFIMKTGTMVPYAHRRTREHVHNFLRFEEMIRQNRIDKWWLENREGATTLFPWLDASVYYKSEAPVA